MFSLKQHGDWGRMGWTSACMRVIRKGKPMLQGLYMNPLRMPTNLFGKQLQFVLLDLVLLRALRNNCKINYDTRN